MELAIAEVFVQAAVLCGILYGVARHEADYSYEKVAMVAAGMGAGNLVIQALLQLQPVWVILLAQLSFSAALIMKFCWIDLRKSLVVVVLFALFQLGSHLAMAAVMERMFGPGGTPAAPAMASDQDLADAKQFMEESFGDGVPEPAGGMVPDAEPEAEPDAALAEPAPAAVPAPEAASAPDWSGARARLQIGGTMRAAGGAYAMLVNGQLKQEGQWVTADHAGQRYRWQLQRTPAGTGAELVARDVTPLP